MLRTLATALLVFGVGTHAFAQGATKTLTRTGKSSEELVERKTLTRTGSQELGERKTLTGSEELVEHKTLTRTSNSELGKKVRDVKAYEARLEKLLPLIEGTQSLAVALQKATGMTKVKLSKLQTTLEDRNKGGRADFFKFAQKETAAENMEWFVASEKFKKAPTLQALQALYDKHLAGAASPSELNVQVRDCEAIKKILDSKAKVTPQTVAVLDKAVMLNISDTFSRFTFTPEYLKRQKERQDLHDRTEELKGAIGKVDQKNLGIGPKTKTLNEDVVRLQKRKKAEAEKAEAEKAK